MANAADYQIYALSFRYGQRHSVEFDSEFMTPQRGEYHTDAGYSGSRVTVPVTGHTQELMIGAYARYNLEAAVFADSPLVETRNYFFPGVVCGWVPRTRRCFINRGSATDFGDTGYRGL